MATHAECTINAFCINYKLLIYMDFLKKRIVAQSLQSLLHTSIQALMELNI